MADLVRERGAMDAARRAGAQMTPLQGGVEFYGELFLGIATILSRLEIAEAGTPPRGAVLATAGSLLCVI